MNLARALDVALPEIPARTLARRYPRPDPGITFREHIEDGEATVRVYVPSKQGMFTFPKAVWELSQLFDGKRSYDEIAELYSEQHSRINAENVREIAAQLEAVDYWYTTAQEKNILLLQQTAESRQQQVKQQDQFVDLSIIVFPAFNPDKFVDWLHNRTRFFYTTWFTVLTLAAFAFSAVLTIAHWPEIGRDTWQFYSFSSKTWSDIGVMYLLAMFVVAIHEFAHAHACKHYGGRVPAMGFALVYLTPAFYTDTTEGAVKGNRVERLIISLAGIWVELLVCSIVTPIWWASQPDTPIHDAAYFLMLLTGIVSLLVNWNPLMKLDGYHMLCEVLGIADLKENSTAYVSAWLKRYVWGLPVEVPFVSRRRRPGFVVYALLSGLYSYTVLYIVARFAGNVFRNFDPQWSFVPELGVAALVFRSRIRLLVNFLKFVYIEKKGRMLTFLKSKKFLVATGFLTAVLLLPWPYESAKGRFILESVTSAIVRAQVPGIVTATYAAEGEAVTAGDVLIQMRNVPLQSKVARGEAAYIAATGRANRSALTYAGLGPALVDRDRLSQQQKQFIAEAAQLQLKSPIAGIVMTPRVSDYVESYVLEGTKLVEIAATDQIKARIYVPEYEVRRFAVGAPARLQVEGIAQTWDGQASALAPASSDINPGLAQATAYRGLNPPQYYVVDVLLPNPDGRLMVGMVGTARIYGERRSLLGLAGRGLSEFIRRKVW